MADANWQKVRTVFDAALRKAPAERRNFINEACGEDKDLLTEVESLFSSLGKSDEFLETPAVAHVVDMFGSPTKPLEPGTRFGHYEVVRQIGIGGMGHVYLAQDKKLDRRVAVKILNAEFSREESSLQRFVREARAASALDHPNILVIHEIDESEGVHYIVSEFIEGRTLREVLTQSQLSFGKVLEVSIQIADALSAAHGVHLVHRDVKPENVMVRPDGYVKVLDFGLAKLIEQENRSFLGLKDATSRNQTGQGVILGTVNYMSPEQAKGEEIDERTDVFSLGALIYEMIAGKTPFAGVSVAETFANLINAEPQPLSRFASSVPDELQRIVSKTLRKEKDERYQSMTGLLADLKALRESLTWEEKLERSHASDGRATVGLQATARDLKRQTVETRRGLSPKLKPREVVFASAVIILITAAVALSFYFLKGNFSPEASSEKKIGSIAVLPFVNEANDPNTEYLSDGLSESLINSLSRLPELKVTARSSSFKYKGKQIDPQELARSLGVEAILTGRILRSGENLTIRAELMDARDGTHVWGEQYNRRTTDLLAVQAEISDEIVRKLQLRLTAGEQRQLAQRETVNPLAYELLLKGRFYSSKGGTENRKKGLDYFQQAIDVDPTYALAYAELAGSYNGLITDNILDPKEFAPKAKDAARKALDLGETLADAHVVMASINLSAWDWPAAERELKRALELNPNLSRAHVAYTFYLTIHRQDEQAFAQAKRARELDPISNGANNAFVYGLILTGKNDEAVKTVKKMLELDPSNPDVHTLLGQAYKRTQNAEAIAAYQEAVRLGDDSPDTQILLGQTYARAGAPEKTRMILKRLEEGKQYVSPTGLAILHMALGDQEQALALLERGYAEHDKDLIWLRVEGAFDPLRSDPRFDDLVKRMGLK